MIVGLGDGQKAGCPCSCAAKDSFDLDYRIMSLGGSCGGIFERMTDEKPVISNTTTSPAAIFPVVFAESARPLNNFRLKLRSPDSRSLFTTFVNARRPVKSRISTSFSLVTSCKISVVT